MAKIDPEDLQRSYEAWKLNAKNHTEKSAFEGGYKAGRRSIIIKSVQTEQPVDRAPSFEEWGNGFIERQFSRQACEASDMLIAEEHGTESWNPPCPYLPQPK